MSDWKKDLGEFITRRESERSEKWKEDVDQRAKEALFVAEKLAPALDEVKAELEKHGRKVRVLSENGHASINVTYGGVTELDLTISARLHTKELFHDRAKGVMVSAEGMLWTGYPDRSADSITKDEIIKSVITRYKSRIWVG